MTLTITALIKFIFILLMYMYENVHHIFNIREVNILVLLSQDKVMLGTDYPFPLGELQPGSLIESMEEFDNTLKVTICSFVSFRHSVGCNTLPHRKC